MCRSVQDTLLILLTPTQTWLPTKSEDHKRPPPTRPTLLANNIDGAFNTVRHDKLGEIITKAGFPKYLVSWIHDFCTNRTLSFHFNGENQFWKPFYSGLPQGSPLSPIFVVVYSTPTIQT